jgi:hypothetical protein
MPRPRTLLDRYMQAGTRRKAASSRLVPLKGNCVSRRAKQMNEALAESRGLSRRGEVLRSAIRVVYERRKDAGKSLDKNSVYQEAFEFIDSI